MARATSSSIGTSVPGAGHGLRASSHFGYGAKLTELVLLGVLSLRAGQRIYWDAANLKARNLPAADPLIHGTYREGWKIA